MSNGALVIGGGGREHALAWKLAQSGKPVYVAPGNGGTAVEPLVTNIHIDTNQFEELAGFMIEQRLDFAIVGPEAPLAAGITDYFQRRQLPCFGPSQRAAQLESSKIFCKDFLSRHQIPTAGYRSFSAADEALAWVRTHALPVAIKADGLAAGKGVVIAADLAAAEAAINTIMVEKKLGSAGDKIIIEEALTGTELSYIAVVDGQTVVPLAITQDHKPRDAGDRGPNTGGMGAFSPVAAVSDALEQQILDTVIKPTVAGLAEEGISYRGFLYAGLMIDRNKNINVLEYNCRLGDPETQPLLMRLDSDLYELIHAAARGELSPRPLSWNPHTAIGVVLACGGYPGTYRKNDIIQLPEAAADDVKIFHAGTRRHNGQLLTSGGRVLCVCALAENITKAREKAYATCDAISWDGKFCRSDIGLKRG